MSGGRKGEEPGEERVKLHYELVCNNKNKKKKATRRLFEFLFFVV